MQASESAPLAPETFDTLQDMVAWGIQRLKQAGVAQPQLDAELLTSHALGTDRKSLWSNPERLLTPGEEEAVRRLVLRREMREPLAYIVGEKEFWSRPFHVTPEVLIPRPETETLISTLLEIIGGEGKGKEWRLLDLGCGSGALAITAACELPESHVVALDISPGAVRLCQENSQCREVANRVQCFESDGFRALENHGPAQFDFILSNPPYLTHRELAQCEPEILEYEPRLALDGGRDGLAYYRLLAATGYEFLAPGAWMLMEIGGLQGEAVRRIFEKDNRYIDIEIISDAAGCDRVARVRRRQNG